MLRGNLIPALACALLLSCCSSLPDREAMGADISGFELPAVPAPDESMVYVVRPSAVGALVPFSVYVDGQDPRRLRGSTRAGQFIYFTLSPGEHVIVSQAENVDRLRVETRPGDILFVEQAPLLGLLKAENLLRVISSDEGRYRVKGLAPGRLAPGLDAGPAAAEPSASLSKATLAGAFDGASPRLFPRGALGIGFQRASWRAWGPSLINDVALGGLSRILSLETVVGIVPNWDFAGSSAYDAMAERVYIRPLALGRSSLYAVAMAGAASYIDFSGDYAAKGYGPILGAYAGGELDLRTLAPALPPLTLNFEGGYEYKFGYYYSYGYPTFGAGIHYWFWL